MAIALDGAVSSVASGTGPRTLSLTTSNANDLIVVAIGGNNDLVTSVTSTGLTFTQRAKSNSNPTNNVLVYIYTAIATSALSAQSISVNYGGSTFYAIYAFGVSGVNTTTPFDPNGVLPVLGTNAGSGTYSTSNANDFILGCWVCSTATPGVITGFTAIAGPNTSYFGNCCYQIVSSTQSSTAVSFPSGSASSGFVIDAFQAAGGPAENVGSTGLFRIGRGPGWRWRAPPKGYTRRNGILLKAA